MPLTFTLELRHAQDAAKKRKASDDYSALKQRAPAAVPLPAKPGKPIVSRSKPAPPVPKASRHTLQGPPRPSA